MTIEEIKKDMNDIGYYNTYINIFGNLIVEGNLMIMRDIDEDGYYYIFTNANDIYQDYGYYSELRPNPNRLHKLVAHFKNIDK